MELTAKPDFALCNQRMEAFWQCQIIDRPFVQVTAPKSGAAPHPQGSHKTVAERWLDKEYTVDCALWSARNRYFAGDAIPVFMPNLGPEVMSTGYGSTLDYSEASSWSTPVIHDWSDLDNLRFDASAPEIQWILDTIRLALEVGQGEFLTGLMDIHPGGDLAASLREPQELCMDVLDSPEQVELLLQKIQPAFFEFYDLQYDLMRKAGQTFTSSWLQMWTEGRFYIPSNDFSCMVSKAMFEKFFLERLTEEIEFLDRSIYHLDGPNALQHLPAILSIKKLNAVQWVYGAGNGPARNWIHVYQQIQAAGKGFQVTECTYDDLDPLMANLRPDGVAISAWVASEEEADAFVAKVSTWR